MRTGFRRSSTPTRQAVMHILLLTAALLTLGIHHPAQSPAVTYHPAVTVFRVLTTVIGLPYLALSATTPLLTAWYADSFEGRRRTGSSRSRTLPPSWPWHYPL